MAINTLQIVRSAVISYLVTLNSQSTIASNFHQRNAAVYIYMCGKRTL